MHYGGFRLWEIPWEKSRAHRPESEPRRRVRFYIPPPPLPRHAYPARSVEAARLLERFFVSAVVAVLLIRGLARSHRLSADRGRRSAHRPHALRRHRHADRAPGESDVSRAADARLCGDRWRRRLRRLHRRAGQVHHQRQQLLLPAGGRHDLRRLRPALHRRGTPRHGLPPHAGRAPGASPRRRHQRHDRGVSQARTRAGLAITGRE